MGYGGLKNKVQEKDTLNKKQSLPCRHLCHGPLLFFHSFLHFFLLLLLHNIVKLAITHDHLFLILHILYLVLFKLMQRQGELSISGRADLPFFGTDLLQYIFDCQFQKCVLLVLQQCRLIPTQDAPFSIIIWYAANTIYLS